MKKAPTAKSETRKKRAAAKKPARSRTTSPENIDTIEELPSDGKLYYRIGEVSKITGVKPYVLRYWESEFRWMAPQKSRSKQRLYRRKDIETILQIKNLLYSQRYTIAGARKKLRALGLGGKPGEEHSFDPRTELRKVKADLQSLRAVLAG